MSTTVGVYEWSTSRGSPAAGQITLASDPIPGYSNTLRVSETDREGNDRAAVLGTVAAGDQLRLDTPNRLIAGTPADSGAFRSFPVVIGRDFDEPGNDTELTLHARTPAAWPEAEELAQVLNVENVDDWGTTLERVLVSAIVHVKSLTGAWDEEVDAPTDNQAQAALRMAELLSLRPEATPQSVKDPTFARLMTGQRRRFGMA